jgi:hypothetical protein
MQPLLIHSKPPADPGAAAAAAAAAAASALHVGLCCAHCAR